MASNQQLSLAELIKRRKEQKKLEAEATEREQTLATTEKNPLKVNTNHQISNNIDSIITENKKISLPKIDTQQNQYITKSKQSNSEINQINKENNKEQQYTPLQNQEISNKESKKSQEINISNSVKEVNNISIEHVESYNSETKRNHNKENLTAQIVDQSPKSSLKTGSNQTNFVNLDQDLKSQKLSDSSETSTNNSKAILKKSLPPEINNNRNNLESNQTKEKETRLEYNEKSPNKIENFQILQRNSELNQKLDQETKVEVESIKSSELIKPIILNNNKQSIRPDQANILSSKMSIEQNSLNEFEFNNSNGFQKQANIYKTKRKPIKLEPLGQSHNQNSLNNEKNTRDSREREYNRNKRGQTSNSTSSEASSDSKKIIRWKLWWEKSDSPIRVPVYELPNKDVAPKVGSMEFINHKPGGGEKKILDERPKWKKVARTENLARGYRPGGGNKKILNERLTWETQPKVGSLENVHHSPQGGNIKILDQPFNKHGIRARIDSGLIFEEVLVPIDYEIRPTPKPSSSLEPILESARKALK